jgi:hypothetical protein
MQVNNDILQNNKGNGTEINQLVQRLQKEDNRNLMTFKRFQGIFVGFILVYSFIFIFNPWTDLGLSYRITGVCYVLGFFLFGMIFRKYYREYKAINYSLPVSEMLQKAAERYRLQYRKTWVVIFPLLFIDAGMTITFYQRFTAYAPWKIIGLVQLVYIPTLILGFLIGVLIWYKRQKPLRDAAIKLLDELNN